MARTKRQIPLCALLSMALLLFAGNAAGQTEEQLQQLDDLTPAQRDQLLEALGAQQSVDESQLNEPELVVPRAVGSEDVEKKPVSEAYPELSDLDAFGYDLFAGEPTTFAPATDIPIPVDYVIGPGDNVEIQFFGNQNAYHTLVVGRDGVLNVPNIGPVTVASLKFSEMTAILQQRIAEQMIGVKASITMGPLRSIRVFVLGDAYRPGSYTVSSLSTMTNALFVSGGVSEIGSLRNVQLKRSGRTVTTLDLYDLLLKGDTSSDRRLQPGDVIFIPPIGKRVGVSGEVRRPAIYEIKSEKTANDILRLAGGMLPSAYPEASQIARISSDRERTIIDVDLSSDAGLATSVAGDDLLSVFSVLEKREDVVLLRGHVYRPGPYQWLPGTRITDVIHSIRDLQPKAFADYVMIRRENPDSHEVTVLSANLSVAFASPESEANVRLHALDQIFVFDQEADRADFIDPVLADLRLQARNDKPSGEVRIAGRIRAAGTYPLESGMRVSSLVRAGGYLMESAYGVEAELTRYDVGADQLRETRLLTVNLAAALAGDASADLVLQPHDILNIKEIPQWRDLEVVTVEGEVRFSGNYPIRRGERLSSVLRRAGGLTELSFSNGAIFLREELLQKERDQIADVARRLEGEIDSSAATDGGSAESGDTAQRRLLDQVRATEATGRLVIDLAAIASGTADTAVDVVLRDGDRLLVPREMQTVTIVGEVQFPTSYILEQGVSRNDYVQRSGGITAQADKKRIYVVRADGSVVASSGSRFFRSGDFKDMRPGDTIVVPLKPDPVSALGLWTSVSAVIYNIGVAAAAVASFN